MLRSRSLGSVVLAGLSWSTGRAEPPPPTGRRSQVYTGELDAAGLSAIVDLGVDRHELEVRRRCRGGQFAVEVILSAAQADALAAAGADLEPQDSSVGPPHDGPRGPVFRPYSGAGGIQEELCPGGRPSRRSPSWR